MRILEHAARQGGPDKAALTGRIWGSTPLRGVLSAALLIGVAQHAASAHDHGNGSHAKIQDELRKGHTEAAIVLAEAAVVQSPQDAELRAQLGHAYLRAGRFESAAAALNDAVVLGGTAERVELSLALAQIACGENRLALATLDHVGSIMPADLGLALALAGDPGRGIAVLTDAVRAGPASPNLRQNLAYAYALDGRWADASLTAGFDLSPDQVNSRLQQWAESMQASGERMRIARLLNVPLIIDPGFPAALALDGHQAGAVALSVTPPAAVAEASAPLPMIADAPPIITPAIETVPPLTASPAVAFNPLAGAAALAVTAPVSLPSNFAPIPSLARQLAVRSQGVRANSEHFVQLAAYHNQRDAERGKLILAKRLTLLRGHGLLINETMIRGRNYWRVVIAGFDGATASNMVSNLKRHGANSFAYAAKPTREDPSLALANHSERR